MEEKIGIIGAGLIGCQWAMIFASNGFRVVIYDTNSSQIESAMDLISAKLHEYEKSDALRGNLSALQQKLKISATEDLEFCVRGAIHVQECVPERLDIKKSVLSKVEKFVDEGAVLASSTSCLEPSKLSSDLEKRQNFLVAHPINPPYFVTLVELVPAPWTRADVVERTRKLMSSVGQSPVSLNKEIPGFALNRIQYAILNQCWNLVADDVMSAEDVDTVMKEGLAMRYVFLGPLEVAHLNAEGITDYCERYGKNLYDISLGLTDFPTGWRNTEPEEKKQVQLIHDQLSKTIPISKLSEKRNWRDRMLQSLAQLKRKNL